MPGQLILYKDYTPSTLAAFQKQASTLTAVYSIQFAVANHTLQLFVCPNTCKIIKTPWHPGDTVVLDCGNQIFTRPGLANVPEAAVASVQPKMEAWLEQLMFNRVPAPAVLRLQQVCRAALITTHLVHLAVTGCLPLTALGKPDFCTIC